VVIVGILPDVDALAHHAARMGAGRRSAHHPPETAGDRAYAKSVTHAGTRASDRAEREARSDNEIVPSRI
jgi:hypothetical protein